MKRSPVNLRPLASHPSRMECEGDRARGLRIRPPRDGARRRPARAAARRWLDWLVEHSTADIGLGWGYHFDVQTRFFSYKAETPNVIATSFAAHALLDGAELLDDGKYADAARESVRFLLERMLDDEGETPYFRYLSSEHELVHNANVLACSVAARTAAVGGGRSTTGFRLRYAPASTPSATTAPGPTRRVPQGSWVDNFHTGYVLEALGFCEAHDARVRPALDRGFEFWERELFREDGTPKYTPSSLYPIDAHNYAQAVETWVSAAVWRPDALERADRCASLLVERMLNPRGYVDFQQGRVLRNRVPFVRWTTAPAFRALARLELERATSEGPRPENAMSRLDSIYARLPIPLQNVACTMEGWRANRARYGRGWDGIRAEVFARGHLTALEIRAVRDERLRMFLRHARRTSRTTATSGWSSRWTSMKSKGSKT